MGYNALIAIRFNREFNREQGKNPAEIYAER